MPPRRRAHHTDPQFFETLGLMGEPPAEPEPTPLELVGLEPGFARDLLTTDPSGDILRGVIAVVARRLMQAGHPDTSEGDRSDLYTRGARAAALLKEARDVTTLTGWVRNTQGGRPATSGPSPRMVEELRSEVAAANSRFAEVIKDGFDAIANPLHYSRIALTRGVLGRRQDDSFLITQHPDGVAVLRSQHYATRRVGGTAVTAIEHQRGFTNFMDRNGWFGIPSDQQVHVLVDRSGQTTVLDRTYGFMMDISGPVVEMRSRYNSLLRHGSEIESLSRYLWCTGPGAQLYSAARPSDASLTPVTSVLKFSGRSSATKPAMPAYIVGSIADRDVFTASRRTGFQPALGAGNQQRVQRDFNTFGVPDAQLAQWTTHTYSPVVHAGNLLLMYDSSLGMPVITDIEVVGVLGSSPEAI